METQAKLFKYQRPEFEGVKKTMLMCNSDLMKVQVQVVKSGGENNLHTHTGEDAFWLVLKGAVKFYGEGDKVIGELIHGVKSMVSVHGVRLELSMVSGPWCQACPWCPWCQA